MYNKFLKDKTQNNVSLIYKELEGIDIISTYYAYNWQNSQNIENLIVQDIAYIPGTNPELEKEIAEVLQLIILNPTWVKVGVLYNTNNKIVAKSFIYIPNLVELSDTEAAWVDNIQAISSLYEEYLSRLHKEKQYISLVKKINYELELDRIDTKFKCVIGYFTSLSGNILCTKKTKTNIALKQLPIKYIIDSKIISEQHRCACCDKIVYTVEDVGISEKSVTSTLAEAILATTGIYADSYICENCKIVSDMFPNEIFTQKDSYVIVPEIHTSNANGEVKILLNQPLIHKVVYTLYDDTLLYSADIRAESKDGCYNMVQLYNEKLACSEMHKIEYWESQDSYFIAGDPNFSWDNVSETYNYTPGNNRLTSREFATSTPLTFNHTRPAQNTYPTYRTVIMPPPTSVIVEPTPESLPF